MNIAVITGNLTKDPELRMTQSGKQFCSFTLAVSRDREHTDYINCIAWEKSAELIDKYCYKGHKIGVEGRIQTRTYDNSQGHKVYVTEILVNRIDLLTPRSNVGEQNTQGNTNTYQSQNNAKNAYNDGYTLTQMAEKDTFEIDSDLLPF